VIIKRLKIQNFRSLAEVDVPLDETTVFIGANNTGKTALLEAVRIALSRRWGKHGTGFSPLDVHSAAPATDAKASPPVRIQVLLWDEEDGKWDPDLVGALEDVLVLDKLGRNLVSLRVTCSWQKDSDSFEPVWEFLDAADNALSAKQQRSINFSTFFGYAPVFYLSALRDALGEFANRASLWTRLLKAIRIPNDIGSL